MDFRFPSIRNIYVSFQFFPKWAAIVFTVGSVLFGIGMVMLIRTIGVLLFCIGMFRLGIVLIKSEAE